MKVAVLKIAALFSYCGGPLFIEELLKPRINVLAAFLVTFLPVGLMVVGALLLDDDLRSRWAIAMVYAGRQSVFIVLGMHLLALWYFVQGVRVPDQSLHYLGIAIGLAWSVYYLRASRRWARPRGGSPGAGDPASSAPIEPS